MNKKINKKFAKKLDENVSEKFLIGSRLWGTNAEKSDYDYVAVYDHKTHRSFSPVGCKRYSLHLHKANISNTIELANIKEFRYE